MGQAQVELWPVFNPTIIVSNRAEDPICQESVKCDLTFWTDPP